MSPVEYFLKAYKIKSVLSWHAQMVFKLLSLLISSEKSTWSFLLASLKTLINSKSCSESRIKFLFGLSFPLIGKFFLVYIIQSRLPEQFQNHRRVLEQLLKPQAAIRKPEQVLRRGLLEGIFTKRQLKIVKTTIAHSKKILFQSLGPSKKYSSCYTIPIMKVLSASAFENQRSEWFQIRGEINKNFNIKR